MAEQKSRLVLEIDSRDAEQKAADVRKALGALEDAGVRIKPAMDKAGTGIDGAGKSASKAGESLGRLGKSIDGTAKSAVSSSESYNEASTRLLSMAKNSLQASDYIKSLSASTSAASVAFDAASDKTRNLTLLAARLRAESDALAGSTDKSSAATQKASVATDLQAKELAELLGKINPAVAALDRLDDMQAKLGRFRKAGLLDADTFKDYSAHIETTRKSLITLDGGLTRTGISARQTEQALRQLPMQVTDFFTSIAGGQNVFLAFLQQGGQIKDSFGGIGNTIDVLGGKVKGLFSSIIGSSGSIAGAGAALGELASQQSSVADGSEAAAGGLGGMAEGANTAADASRNAKEAADKLGVGMSGAVVGTIALASAAAALGVVFYDAAKEASAFNKALFSGTASSGQTAASLAAISKITSGLTGDISEANAAVIALAGSAKLSSTQFVNLAQASAAIAEFSGVGAGEIAKALGDVGDSATKAAAKISSQYGLLTSAQYEVIASLDLQGKKQEALDVLSGLLNENAQERLKKYSESLSDVERDWNNIGTAISNAYSNVKAELFPDLQKEADIIERVLKTRKEGGVTGALSTGFGKASTAFDSMLGLPDKDSTSALEKKLALIKSRLAFTQKIATIEGATGRADQERIEAQGRWDALHKRNLFDQEKLENDIKETRKLGLEAGKTQVEIDKEVANIQARFDKSQAKQRAYTEDAGLKLLDAARQTQAVLLQQNASLNVQGISTERIGTQAQALIKWEQQLADIKDKKTLTADQKSLLASQDLITAQLKKNAALEQEAQLSKDIQQAQKDQVQLLTLTGQLRSANSLRSSLDDAAQMAEYERQGNTEAVKRLETLIKIRDINLQASQKPGTVEGVSQAPPVTGIDASVGGAYSEIERLNEESAKVDVWRTMELQKQQAYLDLKAINEKTYTERVNNINQQGRDSQAKIERAKNSAILTSSADFFGNMSALSQSGNKKLAAVGKAAAIAQATIQGFVAVQNALAVQPYPLGMALAVSAGVVAAANVASIAGVGFSGGGYTGPGGINEVAGTVHKGEVVWSQKDIQRYGGVAAVESLRNGNVSAIPSSSSGSTSGRSLSVVSGGAPQIKIYINGDGSGGSANSSQGYGQVGLAALEAVSKGLADLRRDVPQITRGVIIQEKGQNGLLDPSNRRNQ